MSQPEMEGSGRPWRPTSFAGSRGFGYVSGSMWPVLFEVMGWPVPAYAVFMALGFVGALGAILLLIPPRAPPGSPLDRPQAWDLFVVMVVSALFGSKLGHVLFEAPGHVGRDGRRIESLPELLTDDPWHWLRIGEPGYVWYGGMIACLVVAVFYFRRRPELDPWIYSDAFAPAVMIGAAIGRTGCFLAGCCHGRPTDGPFGVQFPQLPGPVHPTQLYDAALALGLGALLLWRFGRRRFDGENVALLLILYPAFRAFTEIFRGDPERGALGPLSTSQWLSIPLFAIGLGVHVWARRRGVLTSPRAADPGPSPLAGVEPGVGAG